MECITFQCIPSLTRGSNSRDERRHDLIYTRWYLMINVSRLDSRALQNFTIFSCVLLRNNSFILRLLTFSNLINSQTYYLFWNTFNKFFLYIFYISQLTHYWLQSMFPYRTQRLHLFIHNEKKMCRRKRN